MRRHYLNFFLSVKVPWKKLLPQFRRPLKHKWRSCVIPLHLHPPSASIVAPTSSRIIYPFVLVVKVVIVVSYVNTLIRICVTNRAGRQTPRRCCAVHLIWGLVESYVWIIFNYLFRHFNGKGSWESKLIFNFRAWLLQGCFVRLDRREEILIDVFLIFCGALDGCEKIEKSFRECPCRFVWLG